MVSEFLNYIQEQQLFAKDESILLAISGGIDSVAMLACFKKSKVYNFGVAHCNFGLRAGEADADEAFVKKLAKRAKVPFYSQKFDTKAHAEREKISIQMAARDLRYAWFHELAKTHNYDYIATAHHRNDIIETVLFNLTKGTGIAGLHGISNKIGLIVRPMLFADKALIYDFVAENNLTWREDDSNASLKYARNLIRHEIIPVLRKINPDLENTFPNTVNRISQVEEVFMRQVRQLKQELVCYQGEDVYLGLKDLDRYQVNPAMLFELIKDFGFNYEQTKAIYTRRGGGAGKIFESGGYCLNIDREHLIISKKNQGAYMPVTIDKDQNSYSDEHLHLQFSKIPVQQLEITGERSVAFLDLDKLQFPLEIRQWRQGDYFFPLGMKKKKKLSDFMIDEKIPLNLKERVFLLISGNAIVWVIGHRIDDRFKITETTKNVFKTQLIPDDKSV